MPKVGSTAKILYGIYVALTVLEIDGYVSRQGTRSFLRTVELKKE